MNDRPHPPTKRITAYAPRWSVAPGETLPCMVSCYGPATFRADVVRLRCGDTSPAGPGVDESAIGAAVDGVYPGRRQEIDAGSYARIPHDPAFEPAGGITLAAFVRPTTPAAGRQGLLTKWSTDGPDGYGLFVGPGGDVEFRASGSDGHTVGSTGEPLRAGEWYFVGAAVSVDQASATVWQTLHDRPAGPQGSGDVGEPRRPTVTTSPIDGPADHGATVPFLIAAAAASRDDGVVGVDCFNGRIEGPWVAGRPYTPDAALAASVDADPPDDAVAAWDFSTEIGPDGISPYALVRDSTKNGHDGELVNAPTRGVPGTGWTGDRHAFTEAPAEYAAIHFHDDDLVDADWEPDFAWDVPTDLASGVYAFRLRIDDDETYVPFFVRPGDGARRADVAFLAPTNTYLAYANGHAETDAAMAELINGHVPILQPEDVFLSQHREFGLSLYDTHADGTGSYYTSRRRPILNMTPKYKYWLGALPSALWAFPADLHIVDWLEEFGYDYDVITDQDLHREGVELLEEYRVLVTGTHPEYCTGEMLDAIESYQRRGGRMLYMGANGFYWVTAYHPDDPSVIEVRKGETGIRGYDLPPGELHLSFTGERGGLWRNRGRPPQSIGGVGFVAEGFDVSSRYRRRADSYEPEVSFVFDGVEGETFGDVGAIGGGAAGLELDRYDESLGTPSNAYLLASSEDHSDNVVLVPEEIFITPPGKLAASERPDVRADVVYYRTPNGGGVFSTGSIAWSGSLAAEAYGSEVSTITRNVLDAFLSMDDLPGEPHPIDG